MVGQVAADAHSLGSDGSADPEVAARTDPRGHGRAVVTGIRIALLRSHLRFVGRIAGPCGGNDDRHRHRPVDLDRSERAAHGAAAGTASLARTGGAEGDAARQLVRQRDPGRRIRPVVDDDELVAQPGALDHQGVGGLGQRQVGASLRRRRRLLDGLPRLACGGGRVAGVAAGLVAVGVEAGRDRVVPGVRTGVREGRPTVGIRHPGTRLRVRPRDGEMDSRVLLVGSIAGQVSRNRVLGPDRIRGTRGSQVQLETRGLLVGCDDGRNGVAVVHDRRLVRRRGRLRRVG